MWDWIIEHLYDEPDRMIARGQACAWFGALLLLAGVVGWAIKGMASVVQLRAAQVPAQSLAELLGLPFATWWIPESGFAFFAAALLLGFGAWLVAAGSQLRRAYY